MYDYTSFEVGESVMLNTTTITPIYGKVVECGKTYVIVSFNNRNTRYSLHNCHFYIRKTKE